MSDLELGPESGIGAFSPLIATGIGLTALLGLLPLRLPGIAGMVVGTLAPRGLPPILNLWSWEEWPWPYLSLFSPQNGGDVLAFLFLPLGGLDLEKPYRIKQSPSAL